MTVKINCGECTFCNYVHGNGECSKMNSTSENYVKLGTFGLCAFCKGYLMPRKKDETPNVINEILDCSECGAMQVRISSR